MNKLYLCILLFCSTLIACVSQGELPATQDPRTANSNQENLVKKADKNNSIGYLQDEMAICIGEVNSGEIAKSIDGKILVLNPANPSTRFLFASPNKLTSNEAVLLSKFKRESQRCRQITKNIKNPALRKVYLDYFSKIDRIYENLIYRKITIGAANQERALLISNFTSQYKNVLSKQGDGR